MHDAPLLHARRPQVSDMLRQLLLCDDSEHAELYSAEDKQQLLWRLFEMLCLGGGCCQFEVRARSHSVMTGIRAWRVSHACCNLGQAPLCCLPARPAWPQDQLQPYLEVTKRLYKALLRWARQRRSEGSGLPPAALTQSRPSTCACTPCCLPHCCQRAQAAVHGADRGHVAGLGAARVAGRVR